MARYGFSIISEPSKAYSSNDELKLRLKLKPNDPVSTSLFISKLGIGRGPLLLKTRMFLVSGARIEDRST